MKKNAELKASARSVMSGHYKTLVGATFLYSILNLASNGIPGLVFPAVDTQNLLLQYALSFLFALLLTLFSAGFDYMMICRLRGEKPAIGDLLYAFYHQADRYLLIFLIPVLIRYGLSVPGTILGDRLADQLLGSGDTIPFSGMLLYYLAVLVISMVISIVSFLLLLPLTLAPYLAADHPEYPPMAVLSESARLMKGQYLRYTWLSVSFFGFYLLSEFSLGLGNLWVTPYIRMTRAAFYFDRISETPYREYYPMD